MLENKKLFGCIGYIEYKRFFENGNIRMGIFQYLY